MIDRRAFLKKTAAGVGLGMAGLGNVAFSQKAADPVIVGIMGTGGRGTRLAQGFARLSGAEVAYVCDVDERRRGKARQEVSKLQDRRPESVGDFRRILDDGAVDALVVAAPDHWHAPAALLAMEAGKHVYVEKPCSHNPREGELLVQAARAHDRVVQMGNQRRSWPNLIEAMNQIHNGLIGSVYYSRGWYANDRGPTVLEQPAEVPSYLNWDLWQGPAPRVDYAENIHPYNWHWFWQWGTGEAGNNGVHAIDLCRWGLNVDYPQRVSSGGGRYHYNDDWETPDTQVITLEFDGEKTISWEGRSANPRPIEGSGFGATFHGEKGTAVIGGGNAYAIYDLDNQLIAQAQAEESFDIDRGHLHNFCQAIREGASLYSPIDEGHKSTLLCHLGNIAQRAGHELQCNPENGHIENGAEAQHLWSRTYAPQWKPRKL